MSKSLPKRMHGWLLAFAAVASMGVSTVSGAVEPTPAVRREIAHLLDYLQRSNCQFFRGEVWHDATAARDHIDRKYKYLIERGMIGTAEDFIRLAASESSMKGTEYRVRCQRQAVVPSRAWFGDELARYRGKAAAGK